MRYTFIKQHDATDCAAACMGMVCLHYKKETTITKLRDMMGTDLKGTNLIGLSKCAEELGFKTVNLDNYCGYAEMGEGEEIVGIAGHLDIVPVGGDWTYDPFKLTREGDYIYGRGTTDDLSLIHI